MAQYRKPLGKAFRTLFWTSGSKSFGTVERSTLNLLQGLTLILSGLDDLSNGIERHFFQFYDLLVAGPDRPLNSGSEIPYSVAEIAFVFSSRRTLIAASLIVSSVGIGPSVAVPVIALVSPGTRFRRRHTRQHHYYRAQQTPGTKSWHRDTPSLKFAGTVEVPISGSLRAVTRLSTSLPNRRRRPFGREWNTIVLCR